MKAKVLNGAELAGYIKERHAKEVRSIVGTYAITPKLVIVAPNISPVSGVYLRLKQAYAHDIGVAVEVSSPDESEISELISSLNTDKSVHGIIVQLPLKDTTITDRVLGQIDPKKDIDGLGPNAQAVPATALAIQWLLTGYDIPLDGKKIAVVGQGRLVGKPLTELFRQSGYMVEAYDEHSNISSVLPVADIIITATGVPALITPEMVAEGAVLIDAGTANDNGVVVGDVAPSVRNRSDVSITPFRGGVGPLTVAALFDNLLIATRAQVS